MRALHEFDLHAQPRVSRAMDQREQRKARTWQQRDLDPAQRHAVFRLEPGHYNALRLARAHRTPLGAPLRRPDARPHLDLAAPPTLAIATGKGDTGTHAPAPNHTP